MLCDQAAAAILSLPPDLKRRFWVVMDEVASLQELPALTPDGGLLTMSRKHGGGTILGLQDIGQLRRLYGIYGAQSISGSCLTRLMLRSVELLQGEPHDFVPFHLVSDFEPHFARPVHRQLAYTFPLEEGQKGLRERL